MVFDHGALTTVLWRQFYFKEIIQLLRDIIAIDPSKAGQVGP